MFASNDVGVVARPAEAASDLFHVKTADGKCTISIDTVKAPELKDWAETKLAPALAEWHPANFGISRE